MSTQRTLYACLVDTASRLRYLSRLAYEARKNSLEKKLAGKADELEAEASRLRKILHKKWARSTVTTLDGLRRAQSEINKALAEVEKDAQVFKRAGKAAVLAGRAIGLVRKLL